MVFSVGVTSPTVTTIPNGIAIPMGFITPCQNRPKFDFSIRVTNPRGIPIPQGIKVKSEKLLLLKGIGIPMGFITSEHRSRLDFSVGVINNNNNNNNSHGNSNSQVKISQNWIFHFL